MVTLQEYVNNLKNKVEIKEINIDGINNERASIDKLEGGELNLSQFPNLERLVIGYEDKFKTSLTKLNVSGCNKLEILDCYYQQLNSVVLGGCPNLNRLVLSDNKLTSVDFLKSLSNPEKLELLVITNNNIETTDIEIFSKFVNLKLLRIGSASQNLDKHNLFHGSLKSWKNLTKLDGICIENTDIDSGLEYLTDHLSGIVCSSHNSSAKVAEIQRQLEPYYGSIIDWRKANQDKIRAVFNIPSENRWGKGDKEIVEKSTQTEISVTDKQTQTKELSEKKELEKLRAENEKLKTEHKGLNERVTRLEKQVEKIEAFNFQIEVPPK